MRRCFLCRADMLAPTGRTLAYPDGAGRTFVRACGSCGVLLTEDAEPDACRRDLDARLSRPLFAPDPCAPYGLDLYTLRTAATGLGRGVRPLDAAGRAELSAPHGRLAAAAALFDLARADVSATDTVPDASLGARPVSLGLLCRAGEVEAVLAGLPAHAAWTDDAAILVDAAAEPPRAVPVTGFPPGGVRLAARPLAGDFSAQRNILRGLARRPWMLQLDADEHLDPRAGALLPALAALAEDGDCLSIGLPRRNRVDGAMSDVFPDVQYRLNRAGVAYAGRIHERPQIGGWRRGFISLHGAIEHRLDGAHVRARSRRYEAMNPGRGRPEEELALLRPYRD